MVQIPDASVGIKWFLEESGREKALDLLSQVFERPESFAVPELFYFELVHVFNKMIPSASREQLSLLKLLTTLGWKRFSMTDELVEDIVFFQKKGLSGYYAAYVALAKSVNGKWITFDAKAHKKIASLKLSVLLS